MINVFTDLHHGDLFHSLHSLFEKRLGWNLYRPIGLEWFTQGYWKIAEPYGNAQDTINQYLAIRPDVAYDPYKNLNGQCYIIDDVYFIYDDAGHKYHQRAVTLEQFKSMKFDIIMPSFPGHDKPYEILRNKYQPQAKMVMQMGNIGQKTHLPNVLHSNAFSPSVHQNAIRYHQEIDPKQFYFTEPPIETKNIYSVVNCAPYLNKYNQYKQVVTEANWKYFGSGSPDGVLCSAINVGKKMREANIAWHLKPSGGVGHSAKGWFTTGRPLITNMSENRKAGADALALFEPGITCIDLDVNTVHENCKMIRKMLEPEENLRWAKRVNNRFNDIVNYDRDEEKIRHFLENLR